MNSRHLHRCAIRFPRTLDDAFKTPRYASAIEKPLPSFWQRLILSLKEAWNG
jgi:hypothetical protein